MDGQLNEGEKCAKERTNKRVSLRVPVQKPNTCSSKETQRERESLGERALERGCDDVTLEKTVKHCKRRFYGSRSIHVKT